MTTGDPYEDADNAAQAAGLSDVVWKLITEIGRMSQIHQRPVSAEEIGKALVRYQRHYAEFSNHLRNTVKQGWVVQFSEDRETIFALTVEGARFVGFKCPVYDLDGRKDPEP